MMFMTACALVSRASPAGDWRTMMVKCLVLLVGLITLAGCGTAAVPQPAIETPRPAFQFVEFYSPL